MATYRTACPDCKVDGQLFVIGGLFAARWPVTASGFTVDVDELEIHPSEVNVWCANCGHVESGMDVRAVELEEREES